MIGRLTGTVISLEESRTILLDVQGVGYEVMCSAGTFSELEVGQDASLIIFTDMREATLSLYGFRSSLEKQIFTFLNEVKGVGPRSALEILSSIEASELLRVIGSGDVSRIQKAKGVGKKTAERIVLELQDKVSQYAVATQGLKAQIETVASESEAEDSVLALISLGFTKADSERAVGRVRSEAAELTDPGEIVKKALGYL